ncbi:hypothetical protein [Dokdonella koreensis]|uniref:Uncharacterized protein n=1 Tax=Dokdonella koreensis DS-123 TaxID=1300342 RepID=A0A167GLA9_9GAMM|nr:hypothetical protein [Dokdonella koreensis]ANB16688.1 Hypothetical protein I596_652 [Dokdonella koreensis DS-123]
MKSINQPVRRSDTPAVDIRIRWMSAAAPAQRKLLLPAQSARSLASGAAVVSVTAQWIAVHCPRDTIDVFASIGGRTC